MLGAKDIQLLGHVENVILQPGLTVGMGAEFVQLGLG